MPYGLVSQERTWSYAQGWQAEQVFCLPFIGGFTITGGTNVDGIYTGVDDFVSTNYLVFYPGSTLLQVTKITDKPWMEGDIVYPGGMSVSRRVTFSYSIVYLTVPWPDNIDQPVYAAGTTLKLKSHYAGQHLTIPPAAIQPNNNGPAPSPNTHLSQYLALAEFVVEWDRVTDTADLDFSDLIGCVNEDTFMGCDPGTLLCQGAPQENSTILNPADPLAWKTSVTLKQRKIIVSDGPNAGVYGWNDWYNPSTQQWEALTLTNGQPPYDSATFAGMFS